MNEAVHGSVEALVLRCPGQQIGIENDLIERGKVGIDSQLAGGAGEDRGAGNLGAGAGQGGEAHMVDAGVLHQVPPLVVAARTGVGEHQCHRFGKIEGASAANADYRAGLLGARRSGAFGQFVHVAGFGLVIDVDEQDEILLCHRQLLHEGLAPVHAIDQENRRRRGALPLGGENSAELRDTAATENQQGHNAKITISHKILPYQ